MRGNGTRPRSTGIGAEKIAIRRWPVRFVTFLTRGAGRSGHGRALERQLRAAFRSRQKASLKGRARLERRLSELHEEKLAKLDGLRYGIDPALIGEASTDYPRKRVASVTNSAG